MGALLATSSTGSYHPFSPTLPGEMLTRCLGMSALARCHFHPKDLSLGSGRALEETCKSESNAQVCPDKGSFPRPTKAPETNPRQARAWQNGMEAIPELCAVVVGMVWAISERGKRAALGRGGR